FARLRESSRHTIHDRHPATFVYSLPMTSGIPFPVQHSEVGDCCGAKCLFPRTKLAAPIEELNRPIERLRSMSRHQDTNAEADAGSSLLEAGSPSRLRCDPLDIPPLNHLQAQS